jgi:repressor LexA
MSYKTRPVTEKQFEVYLYLKRVIGNGHHPTIREIGARFGMRSPNAVMCHLKALERKGMLVRTPETNRGIVLVPQT